MSVDRNYSIDGINELFHYPREEKESTLSNVLGWTLEFSFYALPGMLKETWSYVRETILSEDEIKYQDKEMSLASLI